MIQSPGRRFEAIRKMTPIQMQLSLFIGSTARIRPDIFETFLLGVTNFRISRRCTSLIRMSLLQSCFGSIPSWELTYSAYPGMFENDCHFPKVGYLGFPGGYYICSTEAPEANREFSRSGRNAWGRCRDDMLFAFFALKSC